jgi:hypothetical protein
VAARAALARKGLTPLVRCDRRACIGCPDQARLAPVRYSVSRIVRSPWKCSRRH